MSYHFAEIGDDLLPCKNLRTHKIVSVSFDRVCDMDAVRHAYLL